MKNILLAAALVLSTIAPALAKSSVVVTDEIGHTINVCAFKGLPPMLMFWIEAPDSLAGWWVQIGEHPPVELNIASQFNSWEINGDEYYLTDSGLSVTKKGEAQGTNHKGDCFGLISPKR